MSEDDQKPRVRVEVIGDPSAIFEIQSAVAAMTAGVRETLSKTLAKQVVAVNQAALAALSASIKPSIVAQSGNDRSYERQTILALVCDQNAQMLRLALTHSCTLRRV